MNIYYDGICAKCGKDEGHIEVHHKDGNHGNDVLENMIYLCAKCHKRWHVKKWDYKDCGLESVHLMHYPLKRGPYKIKRVKERRKMDVCNNMFTGPQVAEMFDLTLIQIAFLCDIGEIFAYHPRRQYLIPRESLDEFKKMMRLKNV